MWAFLWGGPEMALAQDRLIKPIIISFHELNWIYNLSKTAPGVLTLLEGNPEAIITQDAQNHEGFNYDL